MFDILLADWTGVDASFARCLLAEGAVRALQVVVLDVLGEHRLEVTSSEDEHLVEAFAPDGPDESLRDGVGPWTGILRVLMPSAVTASRAPRRPSSTPWPARYGA